MGVPVLLRVALDVRWNDPNLLHLDGKVLAKRRENPSVAVLPPAKFLLPLHRGEGKGKESADQGKEATDHAERLLHRAHLLMVAIPLLHIARMSPLQTATSGKGVILIVHGRGQESSKSLRREVKVSPFRHMMAHMERLIKCWHSYSSLMPPSEEKTSRSLQSSAMWRCTSQRPQDSGGPVSRHKTSIQRHGSCAARLS